MAQWTPEHPVDAALAARLVREQFPDVAGEPDPGGAGPEGPTRVGEGWDNDVWRFGDVAFRFPRRKFGVDVLAIELRVMPWLAPRLPLPVPCPAYVGRPTDAFPYPWYGHRLVPGTTADRARLDDAARHRLAPALGAFLRALHATVPPEDVLVPEAVKKSDPARPERISAEPARLLAGGRYGALADAAMARIASTPHSGAGRVLLHGDLYSRHLLVDAARGPGDSGLCGVIDWGDVGMGDPAVDLQIALTMLPAPARRAFADAYGHVDADTWARARRFALAHGLSVLAYAVDVADEPLETETAAGVDRAMAGDPLGE